MTIDDFNQTGYLSWLIWVYCEHMLHRWFCYAQGYLGNVYSFGAWCFGIFVKLDPQYKYRIKYSKILYTKELYVMVYVNSADPD